MTTGNWGKSALFAGALAIGGVLVMADASQARTQAPKKTDWSRAIERTAGGHLYGNPAAEAKLTEFVSYTCPHCATFAKQGDPALKLVYVPSGRLSLEIRHVIRDPIDWTAAVLTNCGDPKKFALNHSLFMQRQDKWLAIARNATDAQAQRWSNTDRKSARQAIASDLGFYDIMVTRGYSRVEIDTCLNDDLAARTLVMQSIDEAKRMGVEGTPSFALNGELLEGTHSWPALQQRIDGYFDAQKGQ